MHTKKFYVRENDGLLEDYQEITFLFDSNCKEPNDKVMRAIKFMKGWYTDV